MTSKLQQTENLSTAVTDEDMLNGVEDEYGVVYSKDGKRLLACKNEDITEYTIKADTKVICDDAFSISDILQSINIPSSVTAIGSNPFSCCNKLQINLSSNSCFRIIDNLLISDSGTLISCLNTDKYIAIPSSVTAIGNAAFYECRSLQSINIPSSVTIIGNWAFGACDSLHSINIPSSVTIIGDLAFCVCRSLKSINIPSSVTKIGNETFECCEALENINIPSSVTSIGYWAFGQCSALKSINIPSSVTKIGNNPFIGCENLQINLPDNKYFKIVDNLLISNNGELISCLNTKSHINIPSSVTRIGNWAFSQCSALQSVSIPSSVTTIGNGAFFGCRSLKSINIPSSVIIIGNRAFEGCKALQSVNIPSSVTFWLSRIVQPYRAPLFLHQ